MARRVHAGHLGGLSADERAAGLAAALGDAGDDLLGLGRAELARGEVVEEEEGLCAADHHVVHTHGDEVDADGVVPLEPLREQELGADAVGAADEEGILVAAHEGK